MPSENRYADVDDDGSPDVAIGRLPVQTLEEADVMVDKIAGQATALAAAAGRHLFVAGQQLRRTTRPSAARRTPWPRRCPRAASCSRSPTSPPGPRPRGRRSARRWRSGAALTHYFGHGGTERSGPTSSCSRSTTAASVAGGGPPTVLFAWACLSQFYQNFWGPSINEALLLLPEGGALASFGPAGISSPGSQQPLVEAVYRNLRPGVRLGELLRQSKAEALAGEPALGPQRGRGLQPDRRPGTPPAVRAARSWDACVRHRTADGRALAHYLAQIAVAQRSRIPRPPWHVLSSAGFSAPSDLDR